MTRRPLASPGSLGAFALVAALALLGALALAPPVGAVTRRMFVTDGSCNGDLGACSAEIGDTGVTAGNNLCQAAAVAAGLSPGGEPFRAWISDSTADAFCNVLGLAGHLADVPPCGQDPLPAGGPWMRLDGVPFSSLAGVAGSRPLTPASITESLAHLGLQNFHTGTTTFGAVSANNCTNWTDGTAGSQVDGGNTDSTSSDFASGASVGCNAPQRLLCLEVGGGDPLVYPSLPGALAFVTAATGSGKLSTWPGSSSHDGVAGATGVCRTAATAAKLPFPASFEAWVSVSGDNASARLTIDGPWERIDGVPLAATKTELTNGNLRAEIDVDENGGRVGEDMAYTGTSDGGTWSGDDCVAWSSEDSGQGADTGKTWRAVQWSSALLRTCDLAHHLYCFSNQLLLGWDNFESGNFSRWTAVGP
ncbi:MAG: hypothetical protein U0X73_11590 [Thermoanaerobaculia bacterium]